jgi:hypothetical protein
VIGVAPERPRFRILDSVHPDAVRTAMANAATTLFVFASKSGTTIEPNAMAAEARRRVTDAGFEAWGSRFLAITDPGTALERLAREASFREVVVNPPDIGGRYSALSNFGLLPAALMGADLRTLLDQASRMEAACTEASAMRNPGLALGALMAAGAASGRDKLTLLVPERLASFGLWVEQLVAESTGKQGRGVVPITGEPVAVPFGSDRVVVAVTLGTDQPDATVLGRAKDAGVPIASLQLSGPLALGAEFLRWEVATAAAGWLLGINPFDEPNVQQAKDATRALLETYRSDGLLPAPAPDAVLEGAAITLGRAARARLGQARLSVAALVGPGDYLGLLAYLPPDEPGTEQTVEAFRAAIGRRSGCATMFGYGPRYLHSTGQLHKGGPDSGVFLIVTAEGTDDLPVPGEPFSFGVLQSAQALGDFQSLDHEGRRVMHVHLPTRDVGLLSAVLTTLAA